MTGIIGEAEDWIEEAAGEVEHIAEEIIRPRPGGKIDTARRLAAQHEKELPVAETDTLIKGRPVAVDELLADNGLAITVTLNSANPVLQLLPRDSTRRSAVLLAVDNDVYVSTMPGLATAAAASDGASFTGVFYLPAGIAVPWQSTAPLWAAVTTTATSSRISVMSAYKEA